MPTTPRLWVQIKSGIRPETDAEYLVRLRERAREKQISRSQRSALHRYPPQSRLNGRCCGARRLPGALSKSAAAWAAQRSNAASDV